MDDLHKAWFHNYCWSYKMNRLLKYTVHITGLIDNNTYIVNYQWKHIGNESVIIPT